MRLLPSGGSRDRTKSPAPVSEKREYSGNRLETFGSSVAEDRKMGVWRRGPNAQTPLLAGFAAIPRDRSKKDGLLGWRRSTDRARLQMDSLQTGNFTGKFAVLGITEVLAPKTAVPQPLLESFPRQINRENNSTNRDLPRRIREFRVGNCGAVLICACPSKLDLHRRPHAYSCRFQSSIGSFECNVALDMRLRHRNSFTNLCATS